MMFEIYEGENGDKGQNVSPGQERHCSADEE